MGETSTHANNIFQVRAQRLGFSVAASGEQIVSVRYNAEQYAAKKSPELGAAERVLLI